MFRFTAGAMNVDKTIHQFMNLLHITPVHSASNKPLSLIDLPEHSFPINSD